MSRRQQKGLLDELQTDQERDLKNYHTKEITVQLESDSSDSDQEKQQNKALKCLPRFLLKNQINLDNAFQLELPDEIHLALNANFLKSSIYLQSLATLYGIRVESALRDSFKVKCGLLRIYGVNTYEDNELNIEDQERDKEQAVEKSKQLSKKKIAHYGFSTIDRGALDIKQYDTVQINPFFHQVSKRLDLQSLSSMLTYRPLYSDDLEMIIDPEQLIKSEQNVPQHQSVKIEFQFQPPQPIDYDKYLPMNIMNEMQEEEGTMFFGFSRLKQLIVDDSKKFKIKITKTQSKTENKSSEHDQNQNQLDWNQFLDNTQYQEQLINEEEDINHFQNESLGASQNVEQNGATHSHMEEENFQVVDTQLEMEEVEWQFVNTNFDENVAPKQIESLKNEVQEFEADYQFNQQKYAQDQIEDQSSSNINIGVVSNHVPFNQQDSLKIRDILDMNMKDTFKYNQTYSVAPLKTPDFKQSTSSSSQFDFYDHLNYDRTVFQHRKQYMRQQPKEIQIRCTEKIQLEFSLARFFEFSLRQIFHHEATDPTQQQNQELDEIVYEENIFFQESQDQVESLHSNQMVQEQIFVPEEPQIEPDLQPLDNNISMDGVDVEQEALSTQKQELVVTKLDQSLSIIQKTEIEIKMQEEPIIKSEPRQSTKQPYKVQFKVILPSDKQNQIPVKLLKQCVFRIIQPILTTGENVSFSRIWLTLRYILPQCYQLVTVGQLYIAVLFLCNEEQLVLQRLADVETEFTIQKKPVMI